MTELLICHVLYVHFTSNKVLNFMDDICVRYGKLESMSTRLNEKLRILQAFVIILVVEFTVLMVEPQFIKDYF